MAAEPYVSKQPGDIIRAGDWNDMQSKARDEIRAHTHTGEADGHKIPRAGIEPGAVDGSLINAAADVTVNSLTTTELKVNGKAILGDIGDLLGTVKALGNDKLNRAGDTLKGSLTVQQDLTVSNTLTTGNLKVTGNATLGTVNLAEALKFLVPKGAIVMWTGSQPPAGWALCDGNNGTPDLRGRFVLGAGNGNGLTGRALGQMSGREYQQLSVRELPSHTHAVYDPGHRHNWTASRQQAGTDDNNNTSELSRGDRGASDPVSKDTDVRASNISIYATGDGQPFEIMPPHYVLAYIMKL